MEWWTFRPCVQHGIAPRRILERRVGVPEAVAEAIHPAPVARLHELAVLVHVGDVAQRFVAEPVLAEDGSAGSGVQLAVETLGECQLLSVAQRLAAEDYDGEAVHGLADRPQFCRVVHGTHLYCANLGREALLERTE